MKFDGARWGADALRKLSNTTIGPEAAAVRADARTALALHDRWRQSATIHPKVTVYPTGRALPPRVAQIGPAGWERGIPQCFIDSRESCTARFIRLKRTGPESLILLDVFFGYLLDENEHGEWRVTARLNGPICEGFRNALASESPHLEPHPWPDLVAGGSRVSLSAENCAPAFLPNDMYVR